MVAAGTTLCSTRIGPQKKKKNEWREMLQYLHSRSDRTRFQRRVGSVIVIEKEALKQEMEKRAGQRQKQDVSVGYCSCGAVYPPRVSRGGNRDTRRKRQRVNRGRLRDHRLASRILAQSLNPIEGGSDSRNSEATGKLQILQKFSVSSAEDGKYKNPASKAESIYVGMQTQTCRTEDSNKSGKEEKKGQPTADGKKQQNKTLRGVDDGLLLVVSARIHGHNVRALIDSGATRCFVTPSCVTTCGLKGVPRDIFLELGNGDKILSRGYIPDVPIVTAGLTVKMGLTVTNLLHEVDLVLGVNWLQLVNPVVDWSGGKVYLPNAVHTALLQGDWLEGHVKSGTVTVLAGTEELSKMNQARMQNTISILKCPRFWSSSTNAVSSSNLRSNFVKGDVQYEVEWGHWYNNECKICKTKNECKGHCKHRTNCKLYVMRANEGVVKIKRMNVNAKLPTRGTAGAAGYDLAAAQTAVVPAHGKCLVKTGLAMAIPPDCYGRIAPRSGLAVKKFIDVGAGVIDSDYRGEVGVVLFNFGTEDFTVNMGDKIAQLIFEKIKTPEVEEKNELDETRRGEKGYGSSGMNDMESAEQYEKMKLKIKTSIADQSKNKQAINSANKSQSQLSQARQIISARQMQKLAKEDNPVFLAVIRPTNDAPRKRGNKKNKVPPSHVARFAAHGMTEGTRRKINKETGPKKDIITVAERERQVLESVPSSFRKDLGNLIKEYRDIFPEKLPKGVPPLREVQHHIEIELGSKPPYRPPYRLGPAEQDELEEQIKDLLAQGFIQPSCSPYGAPVLFVPKKDGRWRMCIDYRALNKQTIKDRYPLPRIDLLLDRLGQARVFSKLDLAQGYHQIAMAEDSVEKTAFCTNLGQWEYLVMPFGLCNAPSTFQRLMNTIFEKEVNSFILVYLDDILIYSRSMEEHWRHLKCALDKLRRAKLFGRLHKCEFLKDQVDYLGFEVSQEGIRTSPEKVKAILDWPRPQSVHDVRSFLGLASYYRKFIRGFSQLAKPMTDLTRDKVVWNWGDAQQQSFLALKAAMATTPVLRLPDFERQFVVTTDASDVAIGAILEQDFGSGLQPIAFSSRKLNPTEIRYSAYERELLGIVWAIGQWKHYFQGPHPVIIQTDHAPLRHLPNQVSVNSRVWRWLAILQGYNLEIRHIPGKKNPADSLSRQLVADALVRKRSVKDANAEYVQRLRVTESASDQEIQDALHQLFKSSPQGNSSLYSSPQGIQGPQDQPILTTGPQGQISSTNEDRLPSVIAATSVSKIQVDESFKNSLNSLLHQEAPYAGILEELLGGTRQIKQNNLIFKRLNGILCIHDQNQGDNLDFWRIVVPDNREIKERVVQELHSTPYSAHPGIQRTIARVRRSFWWKGMTGDVRQFVENCPVCQTEKSDHTLAKGKLTSTQIPETKWSEISIDFVTDLPTSANNRDTILVTVDKATRMVHLAPCRKNITATGTAQLLWNTVIRYHGIPRVIYSDRGAQFTAKSWQELWRLTGTKLGYSTAYHPQTQGVVERMNSVVSQTLRCLIHESKNVKSWEILLPTVEMVINSSPNQSTGFSPFFLNYGHEPVTPMQLLRGDESASTESVESFIRRVTSDWKLARENLGRSVELQKKYYDKKHRDIHYNVGDLVLLSTRNLRIKGVPTKLQRRFVGPFKIQEVIGQQSYRLTLPEDWKIHPVFHVSLLKNWRSADLQEDQPLPSDDVPEVEEPFYEIEKILRWRKVKKDKKIIKQYLVLWKGYPISDASWVQAEQFSHPEQLQNYVREDNPEEEKL